MARLVSFENAEVRMHFFKRLTLVTVSILLFHVAAHAQPAGPVATVEVTPSQKEADVGQQVKLTVVAKDASGKVVTEARSEEHTSELQSQSNLVCRLLLEKKKKKTTKQQTYKKQ